MHVNRKAIRLVVVTGVTALVVITIVSGVTAIVVLTIAPSVAPIAVTTVMGAVIIRILTICRLARLRSYCFSRNRAGRSLRLAPEQVIHERAISPYSRTTSVGLLHGSLSTRAIGKVNDLR